MTSFCIGLKKNKKAKTTSFYVPERLNNVVLVWFGLQQTGTFVPAIPDANRKKKKNEEEEEEEDDEEEDLRKTTYLHGGALVESFSPREGARLCHFLCACLKGPRPGPGGAPWLRFTCTCA